MILTRVKQAINENTWDFLQKSSWHHRCLTLIMNQRKNSIEGNQLRTVGLSRIISILFVLMICRSMLSQDFVFTAAPHGQWRSVVCSGDGTKLAAFAQQAYAGPLYIPLLNQVYVSSDSGATWRPANAGPPYAYSLALTPDASTLVVVSFGLSFTSHDLGITWKTNALPPNVQQIALSDDGTKWVCSGTGNGASSGAIYISDDSGSSWKPTSAPVTNWSSAVSSADGSHLAAVVNRTNQVFTSADRGVTWESRIPAGPTNSFNLLVCSADGDKLVAIGDLVCVSTNAGANWITVGSGPPAEPNLSYSVGLPPLYSVSASADASSLVGIRLNAGFIWTSTNSGAQWILHSIDTSEGASVYGVASAGNGGRWLAAGGTLVYTWPPPPVALSFFPQGTNFALFWPSNQTGLVLESSPSLSPGTTWTPATNEVSLGNYRFNAMVSPGTSSGFYRLHKP